MMMAQQQLLQRRQMAHCTALSHSTRGGRRTAVIVQANKLIKGGNRPRESGKGGAGGSSSKQSRSIELNLQRLATDPEFLPERAIGPVELAANIPGKGRGVVAAQDLPPGRLLFVSQAIGGVARGALGQQLQPQDLLAHWAQPGNALSATDRYKLSLLHHQPGAQQQQQQQQPQLSTSFKDFASDRKASSRAKKAAAGSKGFASKQQQAAPAAAPAGPAAAAAAEGALLTEQALAALLPGIVYEDDHVDAALTLCRGQQQQQHSVIGVSPEFALLNHSCAPTTVSPPVLLGDRLLLRNASGVAAGSELTTSYLGLAGGLPLTQRRQLLQGAYGFACGCERCKAEEAVPAGVGDALQAAHEWAAGVDVRAMLALMEQKDRAGVQALADKADALLAALEQQLQSLGGDDVRATWLRASAFDAHAIHARARDWLSGLSDTRGAAELADLVRVFAPSSEAHLQLLADAATRAAEAARGGGAAASEDDGPEPRLRRFVRAVTLRYGEARQLAVLSALAGAVPAGMDGSQHWLGLTDVGGRLGLERVMREASSGSAGESRRKVELSVDQLQGLSTADA